MLYTVLLTAFANAQAVPWERLQLTGEARLKVLFWNVYDARLFTADGNYVDDRYPVALQLNDLRDIDKDDLVDETLNQWRQQGLTHLRWWSGLCIRTVLHTLIQCLGNRRQVFRGHGWQLV